MNCIYCGGNGIYVPIGRAGYKCGFCNGTGKGSPKQFVETDGYIVRTSAPYTGWVFVSLVWIAALSIGIVILQMAK